MTSGRGPFPFLFFTGSGASTQSKNCPARWIVMKRSKPWPLPAPQPQYDSTSSTASSCGPVHQPCTHSCARLVESAAKLPSCSEQTSEMPSFSAPFSLSESFLETCRLSKKSATTIFRGTAEKTTFACASHSLHTSVLQSTRGESGGYAPYTFLAKAEDQ